MLKVLLDFDGVLFDSAFEAYCVCQNLSKNFEEYRKNVTYDEFLIFRRQVTDAWQFSRLYSLFYNVKSVNYSSEGEKDQTGYLFAERFFNSRKELMKAEDWVGNMKPYPFFNSLRKLMQEKPEVFSIISTRNRDSIATTLSHYGVNNVAIFGQEELKKFRNKLSLALEKKLISDSDFVIYIDDMLEHITPFYEYADLCVHANWGYGTTFGDSYSQEKAISVIYSYFQVTHVSTNI